ncbi:hypothetical protein M885DRAFT_534393 [Pelagophyceae sp. CCMP2097]|nr:hypothetical protein M885DRAFT_534393 [Pelagophyceae sp. CCMP2097]
MGCQSSSAAAPEAEAAAAANASPAKAKTPVKKWSTKKVEAPAEALSAAAVDVETAEAREAAAEAVPCNTFRMDMTASFGVCVCGLHRHAHSESALALGGAAMTTKLASGAVAKVGADTPPPSKRCDAYEVDMTASTFGACANCGEPKRAHERTALDKKPLVAAKRRLNLDEAYNQRTSISGPDKAENMACDAFTMDIAAVTSVVCARCGIEKHKHSFGRGGPGDGAVKALVAKHQQFITDAFALATKAELDSDALLHFKDKGKASREIARRREVARQRAEAAKKRGAVAAPKISNVSADATELVLEITCDTAGAALEYYCAAAGGDEVKGDVSWTRHEAKPAPPAGPAGRTAREPLAAAPLRVCISAPGRHVLIARATKAGMADSDTVTMVFRLEPPPFVYAAQAHEHELKADTRPPAPGERCAGCACPLSESSHGYAYRCETCAAFALCSDCALPATVEARGRAAGTNAPARRAVGATVAVDAGARRLWLSDNIRFEGNSQTITSVDLLASLRGALLAHPGICIRLEGHTNSKCGVDCDGTAECSNTRCRTLNGATGGAKAFSTRRAEAVADWLVLAGVDEDRITTVGLAGSRRIVDDTEALDNDLNRRVEVHLDTIAWL